MKNNQSDLVKRAIEKIKCNEKCKSFFYTVIGLTGTTDTYDYFFNKINRNYSFSR